MHTDLIVSFIIFPRSPHFRYKSCIRYVITNKSLDVQINASKKISSYNFIITVHLACSKAFDVQLKNSGSSELVGNVSRKGQFYPDIAPS